MTVPPPGTPPDGEPDDGRWGPWGSTPPGTPPTWSNPPAGGPMPGHSLPMGPAWPGYVQEHPQGTTVLVLGILGLIVCQILGPIAWIMGSNALKEIDAAGGMAPNRGQVVAGRILGIIGTMLLVIPLTILAVVLVTAAVVEMSGS